ncbi:outer membrane putative beta-barrel porin/alpha-amylase [Novosphingobium kunmingense]|uniref:Outer membrane putative beta-barrel porin/alpha-amylase n=1 Tax=Novosphingobium kunmingense TaxID=1211806 RepID=A0A2N0HJA1_9SPHN|nr:transporter [Novosphingobium kunmingense]PKB19013.1 outer membrane putative beta-barrel porin/alpha-amylase [Novosphingobium kunmingense]
MKSNKITSSILAGTALLCWPAAASAGPPFMTDDPEPTETGHWEIYGPLVEGDGLGGDYQGSAGAEINYGLAPRVQLTVGLPVAFAHDPSGIQWGAGDVAVSVKYQFYKNEDAGLSVAVFPGMTLPTASNGHGAGKVTGLLPVWIQKDSGPWSVFGGGGYAINPGTGNKNYWTGGIAVARQVTKRLLFGLEADRQGADAVGGRGSTSLGAGTIFQATDRFRLLLSGGPTFEDGRKQAGWHTFAALGIDI